MEVLKKRGFVPVIYQKMNSPLVAFRFFVKCGSIDELNPEEHGLAHALEHMYFAGTTHRNWGRLASDFRKLGAYSNASTSRGCTEYEILVPRENFDAAMEISCDMLSNSTFPNDRWKLIETRAIISEYQTAMEDPAFILQEETLKHMLGLDYHSTLGSMVVIENSDVDALINLSSKFYTKENIYLSVAGGVESEEVFSALQKYANFCTDAAIPRIPQPCAYNMKTKSFYRAGLCQPWISLTKPVRQPKNAIEDMFLGITVSLLSNYLMEELREKKGLCYWVSADTLVDAPDIHLLSICTTAENEKQTKKVIKETQRALESFLVKGLTDEKIHEAKMEAYVEDLVENANPLSVSMDMGLSYLTGWKENFGESKKILDIPAQKIRKVASDILSGYCKTTTLVGV